MDAPDGGAFGGAVLQCPSVHSTVFRQVALPAAAVAVLVQSPTAAASMVRAQSSRVAPRQVMDTPV